MKSRVLVYSTDRARREAPRLIPPGAVPERVVEKQILNGCVVGGKRALVFGPGWEAQVVKEPGRLRARPRAWRVICIQPAKARQ